MRKSAKNRLKFKKKREISTNKKRIIEISIYKIKRKQENKWNDQETINKCQKYENDMNYVKKKK